MSVLSLIYKYVVRVDKYPLYETQTIHVDAHFTSRYVSGDAKVRNP
jgi:hypothetical protein